MKNEESKKQAGLLWFTMGLLLIAAALFLSIYNLYDQQKAERAAMEAVRKLEDYLSTAPNEDLPEDDTDQGPVVDGERTEAPDYVLSPDMEMPVKTMNGIDFIGVLRIPALELELPIISQWSYPDLKTAPCRYSGSVYLNNLILCGHNYTSHFGNLKLLQAGDAVSFMDMDGNEFLYKVAELEILQPTAVGEMENDAWDLTLFTCTIGGQSRVTVRCESADD